MTILGIETSCDETSAAVVRTGSQNKAIVLSNITASSLKLHAATGGIIPEVASRKQLEYIIPVIKKALKNAELDISQIDAIAVTEGPGLIGALLIGVETAKALGYCLNKPIVPVNHLIGHIYANLVSKDQKPDTEIEFPAIGLIVSGGHTDLILMKKHGKIQWLGGTRDDAAGEALDKIGRLLGFSYPAGPVIEKEAKKGNPKTFNFPRPLLNSADFDFSFSGLKTAVLREIKTIKQFNNSTISNVCASAQQAIIDVVTKKILTAARNYKAKSILLGGGVSANQKLRDDLKLGVKRHCPDAAIFTPPKWLCTDNAAMIAGAALFNYNPVPWKKITANPELYFETFSTS
ncbi:tRNA (adenosine(37)-N6)-threonylcarbamoyltransferase complex transferase subunit TsaD [Patescibacteria group bacterium]|nr:tRNA (adenosine(37)-N6)-threonylcarbamoyltransferase complex transferase subunit TsaD [Patescibacteria group bacterium]MCL5010285.1 tRNA (adenosine(37)-N6)-threonylcarbamoyltransferase complex transferase subunit TsaD [Patescibacteria group bacterium]